MDTNSNDKPFASPRPQGRVFAELVKPAPVKDNRPKEANDQDDDDTDQYKALVQYREKRGSAPRFLFVSHSGETWGCGYAYLLGWHFSPPDTFSVYTTTHSFILSGRNLNLIQDAFLREKVKFIREFDAKKDQMPPDGQPFVERLQVKLRSDGN